jgi:hypothetical protein
VKNFCAVPRIGGSHAQPIGPHQPGNGYQVLAEKIGFLTPGLLAPVLLLGLHLAHTHGDLRRALGIARPSDCANI